MHILSLYMFGVVQCFHSPENLQKKRFRSLSRAGDIIPVMLSFTRHISHGYFLCLNFHISHHRRKSCPGQNCVTGMYNLACKLGQIGSKCDKSGTFKDSYSITYVDSLYYRFYNISTIIKVLAGLCVMCVCGFYFVPNRLKNLK